VLAVIEGTTPSKSVGVKATTKKKLVFLRGKTGRKKR
jgi:hypothetical protein